MPEIVPFNPDGIEPKRVRCHVIVIAQAPATPVAGKDISDALKDPAPFSGAESVNMAVVGHLLSPLVTLLAITNIESEEFELLVQEKLKDVPLVPE